MKIFILLFAALCVSPVFASPEVNPRGIPLTCKIQSKQVKGYVLSEASIFETKKILKDLLDDWGLTESQEDFLIDFYIHTGFAESCYVMDSMVFSIEKQVNGSAIGFIQVMPSTATAVIDEVFESRNEEYIQKIKDICYISFGISLSRMKSNIKNDTIYYLNDNRISMFIFYLKFSNRKWRDIPNFSMGEPFNSVEIQATIWKKVWNTYLGKGTISKYMKRVEDCRNKI